MRKIISLLRKFSIILVSDAPLKDLLYLWNKLHIAYMSSKINDSPFIFFICSINYIYEMSD